jgi:hypothetical protein
MPRRLVLAAVAAVLAGAAVPPSARGGGPWVVRAASQPAEGPEETVETPEVLPEGHGREDTFYRCTACHGTAVIRRSGLSPERWDELMDWMTERHGMPPLEGEERRLIVGYLAGAFPPRDRRRRGPANPFLAD